MFYDSASHIHKRNGSFTKPCNNMFIRSNTHTQSMLRRASKLILLLNIKPSYEKTRSKSVGKLQTYFKSSI